MPRVAKFVEIEHRILVAKGLLGEGLGSCLMGMEFQFFKMKGVLEIGCQTVDTTELYT